MKVKCIVLLIRLVFDLSTIFVNHICTSSTLFICKLHAQNDMFRNYHHHQQQQQQQMGMSLAGYKS